MSRCLRSVSSLICSTLICTPLSSPFTNNNVVVTYDFAPPTGMWSTDGIHPNARGYALVANKFIAAINDKFGASVPSAMVGSYTGAALPVTVN